MNILLINHYAGSPYYGMEFRPYYLSREWVKLGHQVTIIGSSFSHLRQKNPEVEKDFQEETIEGIKYVWLKGNAYEGSISRIRNILSFVWKLQRNAKRIVNDFKPDLVIASSTYPLDNIPANRIAKLAGAKFTYEVHDLWPLSPMEIGGYSKWHPFILIMQWGENYAYKHVDKVVSLLSNSEEHMRNHGLAEGKFICVPNGFNPDEWTNDKISIPLPEGHQRAFDSLKGKTIVGFAGGFVASGALHTLIQAADNLRDIKQLHFVLVGKGPERENYDRIIREKGLSNVTILGPVQKNIIPSLISNFDICYFGGVHSILHKYGSSANKMTDYMLSSKPIVHSADEPTSLTRKLNCGIWVAAEDVNDVSKAIRKLANMTDTERAEMGSLGRKYALKNLSWPILAEKFIKAFEYK